MGADFSSFSIYGDVHQEVIQKLTDWHKTNGFESIDHSPELSPDHTENRGALIYYNDRWTIVLYSHFIDGYEAIAQLEKMQTPSLLLWMNDSSVWGYDIFLGGHKASSFNSDPGYLKDPGYDEKAPEEHEPAAPNDIGAVCRLLDLEESQYGASIEELQERDEVFCDFQVQEFADLLQIPPAASDFYHEAPDPEEKEKEGFSIQYLFFQKPGNG